MRPTVYDANGNATSGGVSKVVTTLVPGTWTSIRLVADLAKSPAALFVYVDGKLLHEQTMEGFGPSTFSARIGANYAGTDDGGTITFDLDDARVTWR